MVGADGSKLMPVSLIGLVTHVSPYISACFPYLAMASFAMSRMQGVVGAIIKRRTLPKWSPL